MKKIIRNIKRFIARKQLISIQKAIKLELKFFRNLSFYEMTWESYYPAQSLWMDERGRTYQVKTKIIKEQTYNIIHKQTGRIIYGAWIEPFCWCWNELDSITGFTHPTIGDFLEYQLHPEYLVKIQEQNVI